MTPRPAPGTTPEPASVYWRAAVLYANDEYGRGVAASFAAAFRAAGGALVAQDPYLPEMLTAGTGPEPYLRRALDRGMDELFIAGSADDASAILPRARGLGYTGGADPQPRAERTQLTARPTSDTFWSRPRYLRAMDPGTGHPNA